MDQRFKNAEEQYFVLRGKLETGRITREQFASALKALMVQDDQGRYWALGADSGKWRRQDGARWIEADPYASGAAATAMPPARPTNLPEERGAAASPPPREESRIAQPSPAPAPQKSSGGCGRTFFVGCIALVVIVVLLAVGGFLAIRSGAISADMLLNLVGLGPGDIEVDNFRDDAIQVNVTRADPVGAGTPTPSPSGLQLKPYDVRIHRVQEPGKHRVDFRHSLGNADLGSCTLTVRGGDQWQFVALPERIAVNRVNNPSRVGNDFVIQTSALCR